MLPIWVTAINKRLEVNGGNDEVEQNGESRPTLVGLKCFGKNAFPRSSSIRGVNESGWANGDSIGPLLLLLLKSDLKIGL